MRAPMSSGRVAFSHCVALMKSKSHLLVPFLATPVLRSNQSRTRAVASMLLRSMRSMN
ncbi:unnamed protein product [Amoebophrya sp. A120]|nr:unnamed protein product [Amoebophrya sp. A120]|eukprot:GSA120T00026371001.1